MSQPDYLQYFKERFAAVFPDWRDYLVNAYEDESDLVISIPVPVKGLLPEKLLPENEDFLKIRLGEKISVKFDTYSFSEPFSANYPLRVNLPHSIEYINRLDYVNDAIDIIEGLVTEDIRTISIVLEDESWVRGMKTWQSDDEFDMSFWFFGQTESSDLVFMRSWKGTFNRRFKLNEWRRFVPDVPPVKNKVVPDRSKWEFVNAGNRQSTRDALEDVFFKVNKSALLLTIDSESAGGVGDFKVYIDGNVNFTYTEKDTPPENGHLIRIPPGRRRIVVREFDHTKPDRKESNTIYFDALEGHTHGFHLVGRDGQFLLLENT